MQNKRWLKLTLEGHQLHWSIWLPIFKKNFSTSVSRNNLIGRLFCIEKKFEWENLYIFFLFSFKTKEEEKMIFFPKCIFSFQTKDEKKDIFFLNVCTTQVPIKVYNKRSISINYDSVTAICCYKLQFSILVQKTKYINPSLFIRPYIAYYNSISLAQILIPFCF